jgi:hypothetical protein
VRFDSTSQKWPPYWLAGAVEGAGVRTNLSQKRMLIACAQEAKLVLGRLLTLLGLCWVAVMVGRGQSFWASVLTGQVSWVRVQVGLSRHLAGLAPRRRSNSSMCRNSSCKPRVLGTPPHGRAI